MVLLTVALSTPLVLAAMGGYTSERSGVINIGLEGMMLLAAAVGWLVGVPYGALAGIGAGVVAAIALSLTHWLVTQKYAVDHVISGMAVNAIAYGASNFLVERFRSQTGTMPHLNEWLYFGLALAAPLFLWWFSRATRGGLRMVAVGADPDKARLMGVQPVQVRLWALVGTGVLTGLAGMMLVSDTEVFTNNMTAGRGYIALAALIVGGWRPLPAALVCVAFGFFSALQLHFQGTDTLSAIPSQAWASLPYVVTIVALAGFLGRSRTPAGLGKP